MPINLSYRFELNFDHPVSAHRFALKITPRPTPFYTLLFFSTNRELHHVRDGFGNIISFGSLNESHTQFTITTQAICDFTSVYHDTDPLAEIYRYASEKTPFNSLFLDCCQLFTPHPDCDTFVRNAAETIFSTFSYERGITTPQCSLTTLLTHKKGVCQDFAHLLIAVLRYNGIPARYVSGFVTGEGETHAWVEYHNGICWKGADPTHNILITNEPYIKLAHGRDALDTIVNKGVFCGSATQSLHVYATIKNDQ